jgi:hypothetical protein
MFNEGCMACLAPRYLNLYNHFEKDRNERQKREREEGITRIVYIAVGAQTWPVGSGFRSGCGRGERERCGRDSKIEYHALHTSTKRGESGVRGRGRGQHVQSGRREVDGAHGAAVMPSGFACKG